LVDWIDDDGGGSGHNQVPGNNESGPSSNTGGGRQLHSRGLIPSSSAPGKVWIPMDPFTDSAAFQALKESFAKQSIGKQRLWREQLGRVMPMRMLRSGANSIALMHNYSFAS